MVVSAVEGKPTYGGNLLVKPLIQGDQMTFLEIHYAAGVGAPLHTHTHESVAYVVKGKVKSTWARRSSSWGLATSAGIRLASCTASRRLRSRSWWRSNRRRLTLAPSLRCGKRISQLD
jgi:hypothetical protein